MSQFRKSYQPLFSNREFLLKSNLTGLSKEESNLDSSSNLSGLSRFDLSRAQFAELKKKYADLKRENHELKKKSAGLQLFPRGSVGQTNNSSLILQL